MKAEALCTFFSDMAGGSLGVYQAARAEVFACVGLRLSPNNCKATDWAVIFEDLSV